ncbi:MAG: type II secretion system protein N [Motiliproteus sp.]
MLNSERGASSARQGYLGGLGFVATYLILMLLWVPVPWLYPQLQSQSQPQLQPTLPDIKRLNGTLWRGTAEEIELPLVLRSLSWQWDPLALLRAQFGYQLALDSPQNRVQVSIAWDRSVALNDLQLSGRLSDWFSTFQGQPLPLDVDVSASLAAAVISPQGCAQFQQGQVSLQNWQGLMADSLNRIGRIDAQLSCVEGRLQVDFKGLAADLQMSGRWLLSPDQQYQLTVEARPQDADIEDRLRAVGFAKRSAGEWRFVRQGRL